MMHNVLSAQLTVISYEKGPVKTAMLLHMLHYLWDRSLPRSWCAMFPKQRKHK